MAVMTAGTGPWGGESHSLDRLNAINDSLKMAVMNKARENPGQVLREVLQKPKQHCIQREQLNHKEAQGEVKKHHKETQFYLNNGYWSSIVKILSLLML